MQRSPNSASHARRRLPAARPEPSSSIDANSQDLLHDLCSKLTDNLRRADAFITTAEELVERSWRTCRDDDQPEDGGDDVLFRRNQVEYQVEAAKLAVRDASGTMRQLEVTIQRLRGV
jgi:hypothetical protein